MLVITRKPGESIIIGDDIEITVVEINGEKAKIAINAPKNIKILRQELLAETRVINKEATKTLSSSTFGQLLNVLKNNDPHK